MIKTSGRDEIKSEATISVVNLLNNYLKTTQTLQGELDSLSAAIEVYISKLITGDAKKAEFTHYLTQAEFLTRADPEIDFRDDLLDKGQFIIDILKFPFGGVQRVDALIVVIREFQKALQGSVRRAAHEIEKNFTKWQEQAFTKFRVVEPFTAFPKRKEKKFNKQRERKEVEFK